MQNENHLEKNNVVQRNNKHLEVSDARLLRKAVSFIDEAKQNEPKLIKFKKDPKYIKLFINYLFQPSQNLLVINLNKKHISSYWCILLFNFLIM